MCRDALYETCPSQRGALLPPQAALIRSGISPDQQRAFEGATSRILWSGELLSMLSPFFHSDPFLR